MYILITICSIYILHNMLFLYDSKQRKFDVNELLIIKSISPIYHCAHINPYPMKIAPLKPRRNLQSTMGNIYKEIYRMFLRRVDQNKIIYQCIKPNSKLINIQKNSKSESYYNRHMLTCIKY